MDHQLGQIGLVYWQSRRNRRAKTGVSAWTFLVAGCVVAGAAATAAQAMGWLHWTGPLAAAPAALMLLALASQVVAAARAVLAWLGG